jgi:hypothetical protein
MTTTVRPRRSPKILRARDAAAKPIETAGERRVEEPVQHGPHDLHFVGGGVRLLHLAQDLRFPNDQRIEPGGDTEQMARGVEISAVVDVGRDDRPIDTVELPDEPHEIRARGLDVIAGHVQLGPVARGQHDCLACGPACGQRRQRAADPAHLKVDTLPQLYRGCLVADSDKEEVHHLEMRDLVIPGREDARL